MQSSPSTLAAVVRAYIVLPHATPILAVLTATAMFAFIARGGWPGATDLGMLLLAMFGGQIAIGAVNELVDVELDRRSRPDKPLVSGLVSECGARVMVVGGIVLMVLGSLRFSFPAFALCALGTGIGIAYSFWFKRTPWSAVPYVLAIPLLPIWVWSALDTVPRALLVLYPIAVPALTALQIAQSIPDIEADARVGVQTLAVKVGEGTARRLAWGAIACSAAIALLLAPAIGSAPVRLWGASGVAVGAMVLNAVIWRRSAHRGRMSMFPLMALAVGALGLGWVLATIS